MTAKLGTETKTAARSTKHEYGALVGVDDSSGSLHALRWAARRAGRFGSIQPLVAWHYPWWAASAASPRLAEEFASEARRVGEAAVQHLIGVDVRPTIVCQGQAGPSIVQAGGSAGLIVVGTRGRGAMAGNMLGSVSSHVVANATRPVAVVPPSADVDAVESKVVVGVDGSEHSTEAVLWALNNTPPTAMIDLVHCWVYQPLVEMEFSTEFRDEFEEKAQSALNLTLRRVSERATADERNRLVGWLQHGDARTVLADRARDCDLLVVGARGRGGIKHLLLGSVTSSLVHQPVTTTVVVPAAAGH